MSEPFGRGTVRIGDLVTWQVPTQPKRTGLVLVVMPREHTDHIARLAGNDPATAWAEFGPLCLTQCTTPDCVSCKGGWPGQEGWKHQANECQLEQATTDVEVALW